MKLLKMWWFWMIVFSLVVVIGVGGFFVLSGGDDVEFITEMVSKSDLTQTVDATGELVSVDEVELAFESSGTIGEIYFEVGDEVEAGDMLIELEAAILRASLRRSQQSLAVAQARLNLAIVGSSDETISVTYADVVIAEANLAAAKTSLANIIRTQAALVAEARVNLLDAERDYDTDVDSSDQSVIEAKEDLYNGLKTVIVQVRTSLADADEVLGVESQLLNDNFESELKSQVGSDWDNAVTAFNTAADARDNAEDIVFSLTTASSDAEFSTAESLAEVAISKTSLVLLYVRQILDEAVVDTPSYSLSEYTALRTSIDTSRAALQVDEASYYTYKQAYANASILVDSSVRNSQTTIELMGVALEKALANQESSVSSASSTVVLREADLARAEARLTEVEADPRAVDLAEYRADVGRAVADRDAQLAQLEKAQITSPISGSVTKIAFDVGEQVTQNVHAATVQTTEIGEFKVVADVSESDIVKIEFDDYVAMTFDAFGDDIVIEGYVDRIDPAEHLIEGVVYYEVEVLFGEDQIPTNIRPGLSVDLIFTTEELLDELSVPQRSILQRDDGQKYVRIPQGKKYEERNVVTGLRADSGRIQIISGLNEGDIVIVTIR